jgi:hypothetical protein
MTRASPRSVVQVQANVHLKPDDTPVSESAR